MQVESYIHDLYMTSPAFKDIPHNAPVQGMYSRLVIEDSHTHTSLLEPMTEKDTALTYLYD